MEGLRVKNCFMAGVKAAGAELMVWTRQDEPDSRHRKGITAFCFLAGDGERGGVKVDAKTLKQEERVLSVILRKTEEGIVLGGKMSLASLIQDFKVMTDIEDRTERCRFENCSLRGERGRHNWKEKSIE